MSIEIGRAGREMRERAAFEATLSPDRFARFARHADGALDLAHDLYLWDRDLALAFLADVGVVEVALRNAMHRELTAVWGTRWYENPDLDIDDRTQRQLASAWSALPTAVRRRREDPSLPGRVVAQCMFGFWANLLDHGDKTGIEPRRRSVDYEQIWRASLHRAFPGGKTEATSDGGRFDRSWTHRLVKTVNATRNRAAHHEPFIDGFPFPGQQTRMSVEHAREAVLRLARCLDRDLGAWLEHHSTVQRVLAHRPRRR